MSQPEIPLLPLAGYATATLPEKHVMLKLEFLASPFDRPATAQFRNFGMTAPQARELADALLRIADAAEKRTDLMPGPKN
tara:strand:- start:1271 stop:1510 length:240 start_codon:yes stop_codon:yes gene_type:complete